jgi:aminomethyltransferase
MSAPIHTAFHARTASFAGDESFVARGRFKVASRYGDPLQEALAAHTAAALIDVSFVEQLRFSGRGAARMLTAAFARDVHALAAGESRDVVWRTEGGGVRGFGTLARNAESDFSLFSFAADAEWFQRAAPRFGADLRDETAERGMLVLAGPYAFAVLAAAGLEEAARMPRGSHRAFGGAGMKVTVARHDPLGGFAILTAPEHAPALFDLLWRAGRLFGLQLAGQDAFETLLLEAGVPLPGIDFVPARDDLAREPTLASLSPLAETARDALVLMGIEIDSETPASFAPLLRNGAVAGHTLRSAYSPVLRRAIALAQLPALHATPGTQFTARTLDVSGTHDTPARVTSLPFLGPSKA